MTDILSIAVSGLSAQKKRLEASASNIANLTTSGKLPPAGAGPEAATVYKPLNVQLSAQAGGGVNSFITENKNGFSAAYDPSSPDANADGYIAVPNVDLTQETVNIIETKNAYKANLAVIKVEQELQKSLLDTFA